MSGWVNTPVQAFVHCFFFLAVKRFAGAFSNFCLFVSMSRELIYPGNCVAAHIFFKKKKNLAVTTILVKYE